MARLRHLPNAPITEAIFDFRVKARLGVTASEFLRLTESLASDFPIISERRGFQVGITPVTQQAEVKDLGLQGVFFQSSDQKTSRMGRRPFSGQADLLKLKSGAWRSVRPRRDRCRVHCRAADA